MNVCQQPDEKRGIECWEGLPFNALPCVGAASGLLASLSAAEESGSLPTGALSGLATSGLAALPTSGTAGASSGALSGSGGGSLPTSGAVGAASTTSAPALRYV